MKPSPVRLLCLLSLLLCSTVSPADLDRRCLVGVCGIYSSGFAGVLARHGIPYEIVLDHQLGDPKLLRKYDAIVSASLGPEMLARAAEPLDQYVRSGGAFFFDATYAVRYFPRGMRDSKSFIAEFSGYERAAAYQTGLVRPVALDRLGPGLSASDTWMTARIACDVSVDNPNAVTLAEYTLIRQSTKYANARGSKVPRGKLLSRGDPAIVLVPWGEGRVIVAGGALGIGLSAGGGKADKVMLALLHALTDGRAVAQLEPEGVALGRRQSKRSLDMETPEEDAYLTSAPQETGGVAGPGQPETLAAVEVLEEDTPPDFDVEAAWQGAGQAQLWLLYWNARNCVRVSFDGPRAVVSLVRDGRPALLGELSRSPDTEALLIQVRDTSLRLFSGAHRVQVAVPQPWLGDVGWSGDALTEVRCQPVAPVYFSDDFMRAEGESGDWTIRSGEWKRAPVQNPDMGANPFAFHAQAKSSALAVAGHRFWDTYRFRCSARPDSDSGFLALQAYRREDDSYLAFRCALAGEPQAAPGGFQIVRVLDGREEVLEETAGALVKGQSYLLEIKVLDKWIGAFVDGEKILTAVDTSLPGGGIGLQVLSGAAKFDDVVVEPSNLRQGRGIIFGADLPNYAGVIDQDTWAGPAMQWVPSPERRGWFWNRGRFYGDVGIRFDMRALNEVGAAAELLVNGSSQDPATGYRFQGIRTAEGLAVRLFRNQQVVASGSVPVTGEAAPVLAVRRAGNRLYGRVDGKTVASFEDPRPLAGEHQIAFHFFGGKPRISDVAYWSDNVLDYAFDAAPTDWWISSGTWDVTNRWSCTPDWSWFGGTSPEPQHGTYTGKAVIWCKRRFVGDLAMDYFAGPKMLNVAGREKGSRERMGDFNAVLCGDGTSVDSGYAFAVAPSNLDEIRLFRRGELVASTDQFIMPKRGHNRWTQIRVEKIGNRLSLYFEGQLLLTYTDPAPLADGYAGLWTENNGILVPKVTLYHQQRTGPLLSLAAEGLATG